MWTAIVILALLLLLNGIFAMAELAMMTSRHSRLQQAAQSGSKGARAALELSRQPTRFLSTVQVGITLIGILAGAFGENSLSSQLQPLIAKIPPLAPYAGTISLVLVVLAITYFSLVIGELVPKRIAMAYPEAVASVIARPLSVLSIIAAWPIRILSGSTDVLLRILRIKVERGDDVSEDDVRALIARAAGTGIFMPQELKLFQRTMRAGDLVVRDLMVPRTEIIWIDEGTTMDELRVLVGTSPYSHFPVCKGTIDTIVGVVHIKDLIAYGLLARNNFRASEVAQKPHFVHESMPALRLLDQFQKTRIHVAFVVDEYGATLGMLTLNDVTRAIVGDVTRKGEEMPARVLRRGPGVWLADGLLPLHEMLASLEIPQEAGAEMDDVSTVAGLVTKLLGHIAREGERAAWRGFGFEVVDMDGMRIDKVMITRLPSEAGDSKTPD
ncbi:MAG: hemolysin family protein [Phycisphaerales bacterium]|jgi:putative hemolysin|nr:hemolysin family protein [Phycisphaerales bacterium]